MIVLYALVVLDLLDAWRVLRHPYMISCVTTSVGPLA
jgi:hypothetical protein